MGGRGGGGGEGVLRCDIINICSAKNVLCLSE